MLSAACMVAMATAMEAKSVYFVSDHLATTVAVADAVGEIAALEADAFGTPVGGGGAVARYTGKPYDADIGAFVFPFRNYRSEEARWMSGDPSGFPDGRNGRYYHARVFLAFDPLGLYTIEEIQAANISYTGDFGSQSVQNFQGQLHNLYHNGGSAGQQLVDSVMNGSLEVNFSQASHSGGGRDASDCGGGPVRWDGADGLS